MFKLLIRQSGKQLNMVKKFKPESKWKDPEVKFIVITNNETSMWYYEKIIGTWEKYAPSFKRSRISATVPDSIERHNQIVDLPFFRKAPMREMQIWRDFTPTEKAVWYSHARMWKQCLDNDQPYIIVEHDCLADSLIDKNKLAPFDMVVMSRRCNKPDGKPVWQAASAAAYYITPPIAKILLEKMPNPIVENVDGWIHSVCEQRGEFNLKLARQSRPNPKYGNTIDHPPHPLDEDFI